MIDEKTLAGTARLFKVLGNGSRLRLLLLLVDEERSVSALAEAAGLSQPLVSQHLKALRGAGLVDCAHAAFPLPAPVAGG